MRLFSLNFLSLGLLCLFSSFAHAADVHIHVQGSIVPTIVTLSSLDTMMVPSILKKHVLHQKNKIFSPKLSVLMQGSRVDFINDDVVYHNVFSMSAAKEFDLGLYPHGDHREVLFDQKGIVRVFCAIHPDMFARIVVVDTPWHAIVNDERQAVIKAVPKGSYEVRLWDMKSNTFEKIKDIEVVEQQMQVQL